MADMALRRGCAFVHPGIAVEHVVSSLNNGSQESKSYPSEIMLIECFSGQLGSVDQRYVNP